VSLSRIPWTAFRVRASIETVRPLETVVIDVVVSEGVLFVGQMVVMMVIVTVVVLVTVTIMIMMMIMALTMTMTMTFLYPYGVG
jgi:hypothetical protein